MRGTRSGFTVVELVLAMTLLAILSMKVHTAMSAANRAHDESTRRVLLEDQAARVLEQIALAVMGASRETLVPDTGSPLSMSDLRFQVNLGVQDGEVIWSDPERIALDEPRRQIFWSARPGANDEQRMVWTNIATPFLEGEIPNGQDDNGNGLIDEKGLCFEVDRNAVCIRLTLERLSDEGEVLTETVQTTVTCRNLTTTAE